MKIKLRGGSLMVPSVLLCGSTSQGHPICIRLDDGSTPKWHLLAGIVFGIRRRLACASEFVKDHRCGYAENGGHEGV